MAAVAVASPVPAWCEPARCRGADYFSSGCPWEERANAELAACRPDDADDGCSAWSTSCSEGADLDSSVSVDQICAFADSKVLAAISAALSRAVARNKTASGTQRPRASRFDGLYAPPIPVLDYLLRLVECFQCTQECGVLAMVYVDRILRAHPDLDVTALNVHRLLLAGVVVAAKFHDDVFFTNSFYAEVGGVNMAELNSLEARLLGLLGWRAGVSPEEYARCVQGVDDWVVRGAGASFGNTG